MIDLAKTARELDLDEETIIELFEDFLEYSENDLARLNTAIEEKDAGQIAERAHSIKGAAFNLKLDEIGSAAAELERKARAGTIDSLGGLTSRIKEGIRQLEAFVNERKASQ